MKIFRFITLFPFLFITAVWAQDSKPVASNSSQAVKAEGFPSLKPVHAGESFTIAVRLSIQEGWHVNAHSGLPEYFIPAVVSLGSGASADFLSSVRYPPGVPKQLGGMSKPFPVYEKEAVFYADIRLNDGVKTGPLELPLQVQVQACNDRVCLAPAVLPVTVSLEIAGLNQPVAPFHPELFKTIPESAVGVSENIIAKFLREKGIFLTFILIFMGGLALNLTPCVYPMIPITVSYFGSQKTENAPVILARALAYVVGISVTYSSLGVTAAMTGKILGSTLQSPYVLIGISLLLAALSLSMFGLYEIQAPSWLLNKVAAGNSRGWIGALGMGLVFGIVAAPCVDPFSIGLLTYVAAKANPYLGFLMFFTLSLGLGFPYLWLGFFSNEIQRLPKSGMWMVWVKKVFGMVLLGMPLYFLHPLLPADFSRYAVPSYLALSGILLGWVFLGNGVTGGFRKFQRSFGLILFIFGIFVYKSWPQPVELPFQNYDLSLVREAQKQNKPVFIDFSASWCLPCKELEIRTFSDPKVHRAFQSWVMLKADLSQYSSEPVEELKKSYHILGVPTLVFLGADGKERVGLRTVGFIPVPQLLDKINQTEK